MTTQKAIHMADERHDLLGERRRDTMDGHIPQTDWVDFFAGFSKTHEGDEAQLHIIGRAFGDQEEAAWMPLAGLSYDPHHHQLFISVGGMSGRYPAHLTHMIDGPRQVHVRYNDEGEVSSLIIVAPDKTETRVRLRQLPQPAA
jgi:hypothetical protein